MNGVEARYSDLVSWSIPSCQCSLGRAVEPGAMAGWLGAFWQEGIAVGGVRLAGLGLGLTVD
jgi:hypothetical protein